MAIVQSGNVQLTVADIEVDKYLNNGYDELDITSGVVVKNATGKKLIAIELHSKEVAELNAKIAAQEVVITERNARIAELDTALAATIDTKTKK